MTDVSQQCRTAIQKAAPDLSEKDVDAYVTAILRKQEERKRFERQFADDPGTLQRTISDVLEENERATLIERRNRMFSALRKKERDAFYSANPTKQAEAIQALVIGKEGSGFGWGRSTDALIKSEQDKLLTGMSLELERTGHLDAIKRGGRELNLDIAKEMARASGGLEAPTGNKVAEEIAKVYAKWIEIGRNERNSHGAYTRRMPGFIVKQNHNATKIAGWGREKDYTDWRDAFVKHTDERTFAEVDPTSEAREKYLRETYFSLSTGVHQKHGESDWLGGFKGGSQNIAKRASQERSIHFKSAEDWFQYNEKYGDGGSIHETVFAAMKNVGRDIGLLKVWGPNPRAAFDADVAQLLTKAQNAGDRAQIETLSGRSMAGKMLLSSFDQIDGSADISQHATLATVGRTIRGWETISKLTNGILSSIGDVFGRSATMRWNGQNALETHANTIFSLVKGRPDLEQRELLHRIGSFADGIVGDIAGRLNAGDNLDGRMAKWVRWSQTINLQRWYTDVLSAQTTRDLSTTLGFCRDSSFGDLPDRLKITLGRYGLTENHWNYARANTVVDKDGRHFAVSDAIRYEADDVVKTMMGKADASPNEVKKFRDDFESVWRTYFIDQTRESITDPRAMTRAVVTAGGLQPGSWSGEIARAMMQFKSYPIAYVQQHMNREINRGGSTDWSGISQLLFGMTFAGYLGSTAKDFVRNKSIKTPEDGGDYVKIFFDAFSRGGGLGIVGDILFNDWNRNGSANAGSILGPAIGSGAELLALAQAAFSEVTDVKDSNLSAKSIQFISNHAPLINVWYSKGLYEYLILHGVMESVNPGFVGRVQRRIERENHQHYLIPPMY